MDDDDDLMKCITWYCEKCKIVWINADDET